MVTLYYSTTPLVVESVFINLKLLWDSMVTLCNRKTPFVVESVFFKILWDSMVTLCNSTTPFIVEPGQELRGVPVRTGCLPVSVWPYHVWAIHLHDLVQLGHTFLLVNRTKWLLLLRILFQGTRAMDNLPETIWEVQNRS